MIRRHIQSSVAALALLASACSGGSDGGSLSTPGPTPTPSSPTPTPTANTGPCSLRARQQWAFDQLKQWYLFPETLPASLDPAPYASVEDYIDALTAGARAQQKDRYFTYLTSIAEENAYNQSGTSAGFGFRLGTDGSRIFVIESFEGGSALAANIDRGAEITAIGTTSSNLRTVSAIISAEGLDGVTAALGPDTDGTARVLRVYDQAHGYRTLTVTKRDFDLQPVSSRYGAKVISYGGRQIGYINLRSFITPAEPALRDAFAQFKNLGITQFIVDLRYNGGGLVSTAYYFSDLFGGARSTSDVLGYVTFRPEKANENETSYYEPQPQSVAPAKIAFITSGSTASASEGLINFALPYLHANVALIGTNTLGKPVGQIAMDNSACDDRFRIIAFKIENSAHQGDYYTGLAGEVEASCQAYDDIGYALGDPGENSTRTALDWLSGSGSCTPISASGGQHALAVRRTSQSLLTPPRPSTVQRDVPGAF